jgi:hypothetical protein
VISREAQEHEGGVRLRAGLIEVYKLGLEKAKSVNVYRFEKQLTRGSEIGSESSTTVRDFGLEPEVELQWCYLEEPKIATNAPFVSV